MASVMPRIALSFLLANLLFSCCSEAQVVEGTGFQVASLTDLIPPINCTISVGTRNRSLAMIDRYGPCSPLGNNPQPSVLDILLKDTLRIQSFRRRIQNISKAEASLDAEVNTPVKIADGSLFRYVVTVGLGTPAVKQVVLFDTGSHVSWVKCKPCAESCNSLEGTRYDPSISSSYRPVECSSTACALLRQQRLGCDAAGSCLYGLAYGDNSSSVGQLSQETLTLTSTTDLQILGFVFGCGRRLSASFEGVDGLLGLARSDFSLPYQVYEEIGGVFSYCLPVSPGQSGHLSFGVAKAASSTIAYTPLLTDKPLFYYLELTGISVGGQRLPVPATTFSSTGTIIDSGTTLTYLPTTVYALLAATFRNGMSTYKRIPSPTPLLDTCYDLSGESSVRIPTVVLHFAGVDIILDPLNVLIVLDASRFCLAFASKPDPDVANIIGRVQQSQFEVVYDLKNSRIGFARGTCGA